MYDEPLPEYVHAAQKQTRGYVFRWNPFKNIWEWWWLNNRLWGRTNLMPTEIHDSVTVRYEDTWVEPNEDC